MFLGASKYTQKNHNFNKLYNIPPPTSFASFYLWCRFNARSAINFFMSDNVFYYFAFLFDIKVRNFPPALNFYALECVTNRRKMCFFSVSPVLFVVSPDILQWLDTEYFSTRCKTVLFVNEKFTYWQTRNKIK